MSEIHPLHAAQQQRAAKRSKPGSAGERIEAIAFDLATGGRVVSPEEVTDAIAAHRNEVLAEAAAKLLELAQLAPQSRRASGLAFAAGVVDGMRSDFLTQEG